MPCHSTSMVRFERYSGSTQERPELEETLAGMTLDQLSSSNSSSE